MSARYSEGESEDNGFTETSLAKAAYGLTSPSARSTPSGLRIAAAVAATTAILLGACVLVLIGVLDFFRGHWDSVVCTTPACSEFAKLIANSVDQSVDPCSNFDAYVCSRWQRTQKYSVNAELVMHAVDVMTKVVSKDKGTDTTVQTNLDKAGRFYRSCDVVWRGERDELPVIRDYLVRAGIVWPRRSATPNVARTLLSLNMLLNWPVVVTMSVSKQTMWISVPYSFLLAAEEKGRLHNDERRKRSFELLKTHFSEGHDEEAVTFEDTTELEEVFFHPLADARKHTGLQLVNNTDEDRWNYLLPEFNLTAVSRFESDSVDYVRTFFDLWSQSGEARAHLFVSWMAARYVSTFSNHVLISNFYGTTNYETIKYKQVRWCFALVYNFIGDLLFAPYNAHVFLPEVRLDVERIVLAIRNAFAAHLAATGTSKVTKNYTEFQWSSLDTVMAVLKQATPESDNASGLADMLLPDMHESLARNWQTAWKYRSSGSGGRVSRVLGPLASRGFVLFEYWRGDFVLIPYALSFPLYDVDLVDAVKFGALGGVVATASAGLALSHYLRYSSSTHAALNEALRCTNSSYRRGAWATLKDIAALNVLADAYEAHGSRYTLAGVRGFTATQLLFVSWCFAKCRGYSEPLSDKCSTALRHVSTFSSAFGCSSGAPLNPVKKCVVL
ncbi:membrane metallo-endopeptidase-like 1 [Dermacentor silvarum]|uniref:membrane metallo-endopeptidase-like 1 n=1 Tax=Dermacentor silvarum TaxID=543639 RepID=UPI00189C0FD0|nr:membrane metallo-endopeptidase-like 1 [Dermacentor silvarum]